MWGGGGSPLLLPPPTCAVRCHGEQECVPGEVWPCLGVLGRVGARGLLCSGRKACPGSGSDRSALARCGDPCGGAGGWQGLSVGTAREESPGLCLLVLRRDDELLSLCRDLLAQPPCPCSFASSFSSSAGKSPWLAHDRNPNESGSPCRAAGLPATVTSLCL